MDGNPLLFNATMNPHTINIFSGHSIPVMPNIVYTRRTEIEIKFNNFFERVSIFL